MFSLTSRKCVQESPVYLNVYMTFLFLFQRQEGGDEKPVSDTLTPPQTQSGVCHSFVQEHFQAQYK